MTTATVDLTEQEIIEDEMFEAYRLYLAQVWARANTYREHEYGSPFNAWETFHSGWTPATCEGFNASGRIPVLKVRLSKRQCEVLVEALNRREEWASAWLVENLTNRRSV